MRICIRGATRHVILTSRFAWKIPSLWSWRNFLLGLLANLQERCVSELKIPELAPVLFALPLGFLVVMPRARILTDEEFRQLDYLAFAERPGSILPVERKRESFGWLNGRIVAIDYGS
jgi:hypothetical protein